ncbi:MULTISPECIES: hypothetical protein [Sorangium]|uniref:hypothetical protein n=1 Tax=Sorangium TaxID=39643 RepID=UPI003D9C2020
MTRAIRTTRNRATSMGAAILAFGAGAALLGASCNFGPCPGPDCPDPHEGTCPWLCAEPVWDGTSYSVEGFTNGAVFAVWVGSPREAPDCESSNYFPSGDYYQEPKTIDRCPRCVTEPVTEERFVRVDLRKGGRCADDTFTDAVIVGEFVVPARWDGSCLSQRVDVVPAPEDVDLVLGTEETVHNCRLSLSLEDVDALWGKMVRTCRRYWPIDQYCDGLGTQCIPKMAPGFLECLEYRGDDELQACPRSHPELVQAHIGVHGCSGCSFTSSGGQQTRTLHLYADEQCTQPISVPDAWDGGSCFDLPPGVSPRSVSATYTAESIAACNPDLNIEREPELSPYGRVSYCCRPPA